MTRARRGFSLIEMILAVSVSALVLLAVGLAMDNAITSQRDIADRDKAQSDVRVAASFIQRRLPLATLPLRQADEDHLEFARIDGDSPVFSYLGVKCASGASLAFGSATAPLAQAYPPSTATYSLPSPTQDLLSLAPCAQDPVRITYLSEDGSPLNGDARLTDTRSVSMRITPRKGPSYTLRFALALDTSADSLTAIPNGDFALTDQAPADGWRASESGDVALVDDAGDQVAEITPSGPSAYLETDPPFIAAGEDLQVRVRPAAGATCTVEVRTDRGTLLATEPQTALTEEQWQTVSVPMGAQAGQTRRLRLVASGGACRFDNVRTSGSTS